MKASIFLTPLAAVSLAGPAAASTDHGLPPVDAVVVTADRSPERADRIGQQVSVIDAAALRAQQTPVLADILSRTAGLGVSRNGGVGALTYVYIRGAESGHTAVVVDGIRLNDPTTPDNSVNFGGLLVGDIARVEILRGPQSVLWGSQAIGGVVNLVTAEPRSAFETDLVAEAGARDWAYGRASIGGRTGRASWRATAAWLGTGGISAFSEDRGGREPDGVRNLGATARAKLDVTDRLSLDLRGFYVRARTEVDGFPPPSFAFGDTPEYGRTEDLAGYAGATFGLLDGRWTNRLALSGSRALRKSYNPAAAPATVTFSGDGRTTRYEYQGVLRAARAWTAVFGAEREAARMRSASSFSPASTRRKSRLDSLYLQVRGDLLPGLTLGGGIRGDDHDGFGGHAVEQASLAWRLGDGTVLRASWGEGFKAPSLYQLGSEYGNPGLRPESSRSWDAGVEQRLLDGRIMVSAAYFRRRTTDQIDFVSCFGGPGPLCALYPSGGYYDNIARSRARGIELSLQADLTAALSLSANYTWTDARNAVRGGPNYNRRLGRRPARRANAEVGYLWSGGLSTALAARHAGGAFDDNANRRPLKGYVVWDARAAYPVARNVELFGRVENLFDRRYETTLNYGQPGRAAYLGARTRF